MEHLRDKRLIIRADASTQIGTGHLMRCLALAQAWQDSGGHVTFITACQSEGLLQRLREEEFDIHLLANPYLHPDDWDYTGNVLAGNPDAWVVLDGYHFDEAYQQRVKQAGHRLLVIDDTAHLKHYYADIVLNQNLGADKLSYSCEPYTHLLLGTHYVLLRREFLTWKGWQREIPDVARRVLVTLGGGDPENHTLKLIQALQKMDTAGLEAVVVIGTSNPHARVLEAATRQSHISIRLTSDARNMPELMAWADVAVSGSGSTVWELAWMAVPTALLVLADNQGEIAEGLHRVGASMNLGRAHGIDLPEMAEKLGAFLEDSESLKMMAQRMRVLVDGRGISRVTAYLMGEKIKLRRTCEKDCRMVWEWANDPDVMVMAFSSAPIPWEKHVRWFTQKLNDHDTFHFIAEDGQGVPIGQVRFDVHGEDAEIDISIDRQRRGHGYGSFLIEMGMREIFLSSPVKAVHAYVKPQNEASIRAFRRARFRDLGVTIIKECTARHLQRVKNNDE